MSVTPAFSQSFILCVLVPLSVDVLLCHDDELEGRRVAFILYLVPPWESSDGGTLDLYSTDSEHQYPDREIFS